MMGSSNRPTEPTGDACVRPTKGRDTMRRWKRNEAGKQGQRDIGYALCGIVIRPSIGVDRRRNEISVSVHVKVTATPKAKSSVGAVEYP